MHVVPQRTDYRYLKGFSLLTLVFVACFSLFVRAVWAAENITAFDARINVRENATIEVVERIAYDFGTAERHGIFRTIPYSYQASSTTYTAAISGVLVNGAQGEPLPFNESRANGELTLKIGDPNTTVTGEHVYVISYQVQGPFLAFDDHDEFVWNVTGSWPTGIDQANVLVDLPLGATVLDASCYQGSEGASTRCDSDQKLMNEERAAYTASAKDLSPGEGLTIAVAFPKGAIRAPQANEWHDKPTVTRLTFWPLGIPVVVLVLMVWHWYTRGRDPRGRGTIVTEFAPPKGLIPSVAGVVYDERIDDPEISSEIVRLAVEGYIRIHRFDEKILWVFDVTEYLFEFLPEPKEADAVQALLLERLRKSAYQGTKSVQGEEVQGALLSKMKRTFAEDRKDIVSRIYDEVVVRKYFLARPDRVRTWYVVGGILGIVLGVAIAIVLATQTGVLVGIGVALSGLIVSIGGVWMPVRTVEGVRAKEQLEGFRRYLDVAEKDRIAFHNSPDKTLVRPGAPEKTPELFDTYLPYAIAFGLEKEWAGQFEGIYTEPPSWYAGSSSFSQGFAMSALASDLSSFSSDFAAASAPQSSSAGGGGSVGGGFGGGGGGSW